MPVMAYCKKCKEEVEPGALCSLCGGKLSGKSLRVSWAYAHAPAADFFSWSAALRVVLPVLLLILVFALGAEGAARGWIGVKALMVQGFLLLLTQVAGGMLLVVFIMLLLRGREKISYILDQTGAHAQTFGLTPNVFQRMFHDPGIPVEKDETGRPVWRLGKKDIPWEMVRRVQLFSDRDKILLYCPRYWMCLAVHCLPGTYDDAVQYVYDRVKKRPGIMASPVPQEKNGPPHM